MDKSQLAVATYEKIARKYTQQYFNDVVDLPYIDDFLNLLPAGARILDVGSGPGQFSQHMLSKGFQVTGIDFSQEMLAIAREKVPTGNFEYMDMRHLSFADHTFDGLFAAYSLIHIPSEEVEATLRGFARVLQPGGYLELAVQRGEADQIIDEPFLPSEKMFFNFFTPERLTEYLTAAGFAVVSQKLMPVTDAETMSDATIYTIAQKQPIPGKK